MMLRAMPGPRDIRDELLAAKGEREILQRRLNDFVTRLAELGAGNHDTYWRIEDLHKRAAALLPEVERLDHIIAMLKKEAEDSK